MALLTLLFKSLGVRNTIGIVSLDATLQEVHERTSNITDHAIESGSFIQDHIQRNPRRLTMEGYITDTPISGLSLGVQGSYELLDLTWSTGVPFIVVSGLHVYPLMAFESLTLPKTREGALRFTATMKEITLTATSTTTVEGDGDAALSNGNVSNASAQANGISAGTQTTSSVSTDTVSGSGGSGSLLSRIF